MVVEWDVQYPSFGLVVWMRWKSLAVPRGEVPQAPPPRIRLVVSGFFLRIIVAIWKIDRLNVLSGSCKTLIVAFMRWWLRIYSRLS